MRWLKWLGHYYSDMTLEIRNVSLLGNGSENRFSAEIYRDATVEELPFQKNGLVNTPC
jgi:hypothetical protein